MTTTTMTDFDPRPFSTAYLEQAKNNVQSLDKKRGRPRSVYMEVIRALYPELQSRASLYNRATGAHACIAARKCGLLDEHFRDAATRRRMSTKLVEVARIFPLDWWDTPEGEAWLTHNWPALVELSFAEVRDWVRAHNPRAKAATP